MIYSILKKHAFVTTIDKLTKFAAAYSITDRNWRAKIAIIMEQFSKFGKPKKIIFDNEFRSEQVINFLQKENVEFHFTKPNSHTGNADIERLHSTLLEKITGIEDNELSLEMKIQVVIGNYNDRYHSTIKCSPRQAKEMVNVADLRTRIEKVKNHIIGKRNLSREIYVETRSKGHIRNYKRLRHKDERYYRLAPLENTHISNIKRPLKFSGLTTDRYNPNEPSGTGATAGKSNN